ncbi:hypothetical protein NGTWS0302_14270 [Mycolicibacterium cyprinidarum]|uniref:Helix-turn-helix domain-containing protein n=1 Tax=Mycolicibacterium cyprinidarum TaxID=2860311 RepID=A0ABQ4V5Y0_9MYCO|nr:hypothetical protein NGTWS1702_04110 [Mycolicibacterium sp. NGTWSNA01]GJF17488.1 hypothetical protein NGTWS0302_14270 [Mycolicibacterium sp. NGTWS0302]
MTATTLTLTPDAELAEALARLDTVMPTGDEARSPWLSVNQVAEITGAAARTVRRWVADGRLPSVKVAGRTIRIHRDDLAATLQPRTPTETPPAAAVIPVSHHCTCLCAQAAAAGMGAEKLA